VFWITIEFFGEWMDQEELSMVAYTACVVIQTLTILSESKYVLANTSKTPVRAN
jgi:hypothetical protein